jgi:hypothetical protein
MGRACRPPFLSYTEAGAAYGNSAPARVRAPREGKEKWN